MLDEFLHWWKNQLHACVPARWRADSFANATVAIWRPDGASLVLDIARRAGGTERAIGSAAAADGAQALRLLLGRGGGARLVLRVPARLLLQREVSVPLAAARDAERVVGYEMDRLTPFGADDVYWSVAPLGTDRSRGQVRLRLSVIPRAAVRPAVNALAQAGAAPVALEAGDAAATCRIALAHPDPARQRRERRLALALGTLCAVLALAAVALPFIGQYQAEAALDARIDALRPRVAEVEGLRRRMAAAAASGDAVGREYAALGDPLAALATLTELLPDDTFLQEFSMTQRKLGLRGQSADAARLIAALANDPGIRNPAFAAPVARVENGTTDVFAIRAEWGGTP